mgnify:CR=1 FL=1
MILTKIFGVLSSTGGEPYWLVYQSFERSCFVGFNNINFDAIISYATSPIYQAIPAIIYAKRNNIPSFLWVQDLWPDVLNDLNIIKNKLILDILQDFYDERKDFEDFIKKSYKFIKVNREEFEKQF